MKMKREELKSLIKECLVEILSEGLSDYIVESKVKSKVFTEQRERRHDGVDTCQQMNDKRAVEARNRDLVNITTQDPMLQMMLADTVVNTLPTFMDEGRHSIARDAVSQAVSDVDNPAELFGDEATGRWAALALLPDK